MYKRQEQPSNIAFPIVVTDFGIVTLTKFSQSENTWYPIVVTVSGTVNSVNPVIENASFSIALTLLGISIFFSETQPAKVAYGIELIVFGKVILVKFSFNINVAAPNSVTLFGIVIPVSYTHLSSFVLLCSALTVKYPSSKSNFKSSLSNPGTSIANS